MAIPRTLLLLAVFAASPRPAGAATARARADAKAAAKPACPEGAAPCPIFKPEEVQSQGSVVVRGRSISYEAHAGTLVVHPKDWDDIPRNAPKDEKGKPRPSPEASMFYVAYFERGAGPARPLTFLFNGGPGSSSVWLHMGAFGPRRVVTADDSHTPAAPYKVVDNADSLLDASDLVFVDAPGTGFSRVAGKGASKAFFGVDQDANAFADFIVQFLSKYGRWNSPKYLFGESYGTTRSAVLSRALESDRMVDVNGVILLSQILNYADNPDGPEDDPGIELPYQLALPSYAATAWYHKKLPADAPKDLPALLAEVERFAMGDYARALEAGADLPAKDRQAIAARLHRYTGLPVDYILKANLRVTGGEFEKNLEGSSGDTTGRLDSRFTGPDLDPLSKEAEYDPQAAAIGSAYVSAFNDYVRRVLKYGQDKLYKPEIALWESWDYLHQPPAAHKPLSQATNVMPDLAAAMKYNPGLKVMLNAGYFDLATPFFQGVYEMSHLPIPDKLRKNIELKFYESGHMVYAHAASLKALHDNVAAFIRRAATP